MKGYRKVLILTLSVLLVSCAGTPKILQPIKPYPSVVEWKGGTKDKLFDHLVHALHENNDYEIVPASTNKPSGLILAKKGSKGGFYFRVVKYQDGTYGGGSYHVQYILKFLVEKTKSGATIRINPKVKVYCAQYDFFSKIVGFYPCSVSAGYRGTMEIGITSRVSEHIHKMLEDMTVKNLKVIKTKRYKIN